MVIRNCENCEYHEPFSGVCFCGKSHHCSEITRPDGTCGMWEKRKKAIDHEYIRMMERRKSTKKLIDLRKSGKTCSGCAFFDNKFSPDDQEFFGYCTCSKKLKEKEYDGYIAVAKLIPKTRKCCKYFEEKVKKLD